MGPGSNKDGRDDSPQEQQLLPLPMKQEISEEGEEASPNDSSDLPVTLHITLPVSWNRPAESNNETPQVTKPERKKMSSSRICDQDSGDGSDSCKRSKTVKQKSQFQIECERFLRNANKSHMLKKRKRHWNQSENHLLINVIMY